MIDVRIARTHVSYTCYVIFVHIYTIIALHDVCIITAHLIIQRMHAGGGSMHAICVYLCDIYASAAHGLRAYICKYVS